MWSDIGQQRPGISRKNLHRDEGNHFYEFTSSNDYTNWRIHVPNDYHCYSPGIMGTKYEIQRKCPERLPTLGWTQIFLSPLKSIFDISKGSNIIIFCSELI